MNYFNLDMPIEDIGLYVAYIELHLKTMEETNSWIKPKTYDELKTK